MHEHDRFQNVVADECAVNPLDWQPGPREYDCQHDIVLKHGDKVNAALDVLYNFRYDSEVEELRNLYFKGLALQWISRDELPWSKSIDQEAFTQTFTLFGQPVQDCQR